MSAYNHTRGDSPATPCPECAEAQRLKTALEMIAVVASECIDAQTGHDDPERRSSVNAHDVYRWARQALDGGK